MTPSDAELVQQALAGSQQAYQDLVKRYATPAVNLATRMVRDRAVAEELAQEAFARAFEHLSTYKQERRFVSWFFQILHNVTIDYIRRKQPTTVSLDELAEAGYQVSNRAGHPGAGTNSIGTSPEALAEHAELAHAMDAALALIRPEYREAVVLRYREELSVEEIAETMSVPTGTVKTYLYRARKELASILSAQGWATSPSSAG